MKNISTAVKYLHDRNVAHRDLKPENLLLSRKGVLKLTDFGFAKETHQTLKTPCYTPYYVAPEVFGMEKYDKSCDIWSLGVILYMALGGYPPFNSNSKGPLSPGMKSRIKYGLYEFHDPEWTHVSNEAKDLIRGMLNTDPTKRLNIDQVIHNKWLKQNTTISQTPPPMATTSSPKILNEEHEAWPEFRHEMSFDFNELDSNPMVKPLVVNSELAKKRKNSKAKWPEFKGEMSSF